MNVAVSILVSVVNLLAASRMDAALAGSTKDEAETPRLIKAARGVAVSGEGYFPVLVQLHDGTLAAVVRGGAAHLGKTGRLDMIVSHDGGRTWSRPRTIVDSPWDDRNPAFGQMRDGTLVVAYWECHCYDEQGHWSPSTPGSAMYVVRSHNGGKTWSRPQRLDTGPISSQYGSPYGSIVVLPDGTALMAIYGRPNAAYRGPDRIADQYRDAAGILRSHDNGKTWGGFSLIASGGFNETALLPLDGMELLAASRSEPGGVVYVRRSDDGGRTWGPATRVTGGPEGVLAQHPADLVRLGDGHLLMAYGNRVFPFGVGAVLSRDGGNTWDWAHRVLLGWTSNNADTGYPSVVQEPDGTIVCLYYAVSTEERPNVRQAICVRFTEAGLAAAATGSLRRSAGTTYYVSSSIGNDSYDGLAPRWNGKHGPWRTLGKASSITYTPGDKLLLRCGDVWNETLTLRGDGDAEHPVTVSSYGAGERPCILRTIGAGRRDDCILVDDACGYVFQDLELGNSFCGIHVRVPGVRRQAYPYYRFRNCFFHDIVNLKCPDEDDAWAWAIWWDGRGRVKDVRVENCIGLRTQAFFSGGGGIRSDITFDGDTISHGSLNQVYQSEALGFDILNCVFVYNYPWRYDRFGITQVIAGNLEGGPGIHYIVRNNEFGWPGDYPGSPDGCGYDFEVSTNGVTFQNNFVHNSYGEAVLFMGDRRQENMVFADNLFRNNVRFSPRWDCTIALFPNMQGNGTFRNNTFYLWPGKKAFASRPSCFTYEGNDEHPTKPFVEMPLVTRIQSRGGARVYSFACSTPGATIRYTTDGSLPNASSPVYRRPIAVRRSGVLNVKAFKPGYWPSYVNSIAVELRKPEGSHPVAVWQRGRWTYGASRLKAVANAFTVSFWVRPTKPRMPTPEAGGGIGIPDAHWWKLDEGHGSVVKDAAGGSVGVVDGCNWVKEGHVTALAFDGSRGSVSLGWGTQNGTAGDFTIAFWAAPEATRATTPEASNGVLGIGNQRYALMPQQFSAASGGAGCGVSVGTNGISVFELADNFLPSVLVADLPLTGWNHIAIVYRSGRPNLYVNGRYIKSGLRSTKRVYPAFSLGGNRYGWYKGMLRDVRVYPRALAPSEVQRLAEGDPFGKVPWTLERSAGTLGLPFCLAPVRRGGRPDVEDAGMGVSVGTNGISVCEASDNYLPSLLVDNRPLSGWKHVAVVYQDRQPSLYVDGIFEKAGCHSTKIVHPAFTVNKGNVEDVRVYDRVLTDAEIQQLASAGLRRR